MPPYRLPHGTRGSAKIRLVQLLCFSVSWYFGISLEIDECNIEILG